MNPTKTQINKYIILCSISKSCIWNKNIDVWKNKLFIKCNVWKDICVFLSYMLPMDKVYLDIKLLSYFFFIDLLLLLNNLMPISIFLIVLFYLYLGEGGLLRTALIFINVFLCVWHICVVLSRNIFIFIYRLVFFFFNNFNIFCNPFFVRSSPPRTAYAKFIEVIVFLRNFFILLIFLIPTLLKKNQHLDIFILANKIQNRNFHKTELIYKIEPRLSIQGLKLFTQHNLYDIPRNIYLSLSWSLLII